MINKVKGLMLSMSVLCLFLSKVNYASGNLSHPILVLGTDKNFGTYTTEILKTEGFNEFQMISVANAKVTTAYLKQFDVVILTENKLTEKQAAIIIAFVKGGGNLIAFKPDSKLAGVFGITNAAGTFDAGYIAISTKEETGRGLTAETLQLHTEAGKYELTGGKKIATIFKDGATATDYPAVVENDYGKGHAIAFLYNLPQNIVYTRQGNYKNAGKEMDGIDGIRSMDMFTDGWVDTTKNTINQADEQMRLLSHCIEKMSSYKKPLPRFWYFPDTLKCLVTLTNDGEDNKEADFVQQFEEVDAKGAKMTLYIKETDRVSKAWVDKWRKKDFELAAHFDDTRQAQHPDWKTMDSVIKDLKKKMKARYGISNIQTVTNHWFVWVGTDSNNVSDFAAQAKLQANNGIELDDNYARYDNKSNQGYFLGAMGTGQGNFTGSGLSMKFADNAGKIINNYQHICNVYDQQYMEHADSVGFYNCFKGLMDRSLEHGVYSYISVKAHNAEYFFSRTALMKMLDYANAKKIPVWAAAKLLDFLKAKDEAVFNDIKWSNGQLVFKIKSSLTHSNQLTSMIPYKHKGKKISSVKINGVSATYAVKLIAGFEYALVSVKPGADYNVVASYLP
ncbi:MAG: hypothetical protein ABIN94_00265 [Ferruginibacter sp.]